MFNISNLLNSIDNAAKETLEEPKVSATSIRMQRRGDDEVGVNHTSRVYLVLQNS